MIAQKTLLVGLFLCLLLLAIGIGLQGTGAASALTLGRGANVPVVTIPYTGQLASDVGKPALNGMYDFVFTLYDVETGGMPLWTETQSAVKVNDGSFVTALGSVNPIPATALEGGKRWLAVSVREPGARDLIALTPRQQLNTGTSAPQAVTAASTCTHTHFGESWSGDYAWGLLVETPNGNLGGSLIGRTYGIGFGVSGEAYGSTINAGVSGKSDSSTGYGGYFFNTGGGKSLVGSNDSGGIAVYAEGNGSTVNATALRVNNTQTNHGMAAYLLNNSDYANTHFQNTGSGEVLVIQDNGGRFLRAVNASWDAKFRLEGDGNAYADGGWYGGGADMAEMLPASDGLQAGDVLVIGMDGTLIRSSEPYQVSVAGVYSTKPGFVGGYPIEGQANSTIPLAVVGIVPVKVSAENGAIRPGDLLVSSGTPGHAMKASANPPQGTVIGKAMEKLDAGFGVVKMLATLQ